MPSFKISQVSPLFYVGIVFMIIGLASKNMTAFMGVGAAFIGVDIASGRKRQQQENNEPNTPSDSQ